MPVLPTPDYTPPFPFRSGNLATLYPPVFRKTPATTPRSERIETPDGDFLGMDWHTCRTGKTRRLAIISHGLEGHSRKKYILGMARMMTSLDHDAVCWVQRGCGTEINRLPRFYHSGETDDLHTIVTHCLATGKYDEIMLMDSAWAATRFSSTSAKTPTACRVKSGPLRPFPYPATWPRPNKSSANRQDVSTWNIS